ncbi:MAG: EamA family transporter [Gammaproteobacteria bacterium]
MKTLHKGIVMALLAAALFGVSTPAAKLLLGQVPPLALAGLLYLGSGLGLSVWLLARLLIGKEQMQREAPLTRQDAPWLAGAILFGGAVAPVLLMTGLAMIPAANAALLLNLEGVFTAVMAWFVFHENFDRRLVTGMALITVAGGLLAWNGPQADWPVLGALAVVAACAGWAIDNNLTRKVSGGDPVQITALKGGIAGSINLALAVYTGWSPAAWSSLLLVGIVGLFGYGISLVLFVRALREIGAARTAAYFSSAPFIGAVVAMLVFGAVPGVVFWVAALLMAIGVWLHISEHHEHTHTHEALAHEHAHLHDAHHQHEHDFPWDGHEPHTHFHVHEPLIHCHPHYPDLHHRHRH